MFKRNRILLLCVLFLLVFTFASKVSYAEEEKEFPKEKFHIYLLMGQSNMVGWGKIEEEDKVTHPRIFKLNEKNEWVQAANPLHPGSRHMGMGMTFAREMIKQDESIKIGLIPCAFNGSPLSRWQRKGGDLYAQAMKKAKLAMEKGVIKGILWHQGESDSNGRLADTYTERFQQMVKDVRAELGNENIPVVVGQVGTFFAERRPTAKKINECHAKVSETVPLSACASSEGLTDRGDRCHFDNKSLREFGRRYAKLMQELQKSIKEKTVENKEK